MADRYLEFSPLSTKPPFSQLSPLPFTISFPHTDSQAPRLQSSLIFPTSSHFIAAFISKSANAWKLSSPSHFLSDCCLLHLVRIHPTLAAGAIGHGILRPQADAILTRLTNARVCIQLYHTNAIHLIPDGATHTLQPMHTVPPDLSLRDPPIPFLISPPTLCKENHTRLARTGSYKMPSVQ